MLFSENLKKRLIQSTGLTESVIDTAWPAWWTEEAERSPSARNELKFSIARKLGLDPRTLETELSPRFLWDGSLAKYKNFQKAFKPDQPAITSFGISISRLLLNATKENKEELLVKHTPLQLREMILATKPFVSLPDILSIAWGVGIPVIHLRIYPLSAKRMCAMAVNISKRHAILLARDAQYPAQVAFHLAHELGHVVLGHVLESQALVDMADYTDYLVNSDPEEKEADKFALELLTGLSEPQVLPIGEGNSAHQLASECLRLAPEFSIEPGTLALCFAYSTNKWAVAIRALDFIYSNKNDVWNFINSHAIKEIAWSYMSDDNADYLRTVIGGQSK